MASLTRLPVTDYLYQTKFLCNPDSYSRNDRWRARCGSSVCGSRWSGRARQTYRSEPCAFSNAVLFARKDVLHSTRHVPKEWRKAVLGVAYRIPVEATPYRPLCYERLERSLCRPAQAQAMRNAVPLGASLHYGSLWTSTDKVDVNIPAPLTKANTYQPSSMLGSSSLSISTPSFSLPHTL